MGPCWVLHVCIMLYLKIEIFLTSSETTLQKWSDSEPTDRSTACCFWRSGSSKVKQLSNIWFDEPNHSQISWLRMFKTWTKKGTTSKIQFQNIAHVFKKWIIHHTNQPFKWHLLAHFQQNATRREPVWLSWRFGIPTMTSRSNHMVSEMTRHQLGGTKHRRFFNDGSWAETKCSCL